jgi:sugar-specific transcriptional regulator TrmB
MLFCSEQHNIIGGVIMDKIIEKLQELDFTELEAKVYIALLQNPQSNGSQISKIIKASRSAVYSTLDILYKKGAIFLLPGKTKLYQAQKPEVLIDNITEEYMKTANTVKQELAELEQPTVGKEYWNIKGHENFILKAKELLLTAEEEVYINSNYDLNYFAKELKTLTDGGVRIIHFSFEKSLLKDDIPIEYYRNNALGDFEPSIFKRMMLVVDYQKVLIANGKLGGSFIGTFTENPLLVAIVAEHIHHDIYFLKLEEKYKDVLVQSDILLDTIAEKTFEEKVAYYKSKKK